MNQRWRTTGVVVALLVASLTALGLLLANKTWQRLDEPAPVGAERSLAPLAFDPHFYARLHRVEGPVAPLPDGPRLRPDAALWWVEIELRNSAVRLDPPFLVDPGSFALTIRDAQGKVHPPEEWSHLIDEAEPAVSIDQPLGSGESRRYRVAFALPLEAEPRQVWFSRRDRFSEALPWWEGTPLHAKAVWDLPPASDETPSPSTTP